MSTLVISNLSQFTPVFPQLMNYFERVTRPSDRPRIGTELIRAVQSGASGHVDYQLAWVLDLVSRDPNWSDKKVLLGLVDVVQSPVARPKLVEILGQRGHVHWFRQRRRDALNLNSWELRSFVRGATCLQRDEFNPWLASLTPRLDRLGQIVAKSCRA